MSDITGGVERPADPEFNEVPTGRYEPIKIGRYGLFGVQRPDGSMSPIMPITGRAFVGEVVAELERARLDNCSLAFQTMTKVAAQRDALQVMYDGVKESLTSVGELLEAKHAEVLLLGAELEARSAAVGVKTARLKEAPTNYRINKVMGGWYFLAPDEEPENIYDYVVAEGRWLYSSIEEASDAAWAHVAKAGICSLNQARGAEFATGEPVDRPAKASTTVDRDVAYPAKLGPITSEHAEYIDADTQARPAKPEPVVVEIAGSPLFEIRDGVLYANCITTADLIPTHEGPTSQWEISVRPSEYPLYRATRHIVAGDVGLVTEETMHAESLSLIRMKVLNWFRRHNLPAACVPNESSDMGSILETWL